MALSDSAREGMTIVWMLTEINKMSRCLVLFNNNQGSVKLCYNSGYHPITKHIRIRYHFVRKLVQQGEARVLYVPTADMQADFLTKPLCRIKHEQFAKLLNLV